MSDAPGLVALLTGIGALLAWTVVALSSFTGRVRERRMSHAAVVVMSWLASLGMLASALGSAAVRGILDLGLPADVISFTASFGRGALLAGGIVLLLRRPRDEP